MKVYLSIFEISNLFWTCTGICTLRAFRDLIFHFLIFVKNRYNLTFCLFGKKLDFVWSSMFYVTFLIVIFFLSSSFLIVMMLFVILTVGIISQFLKSISFSRCRLFLNSRRSGRFSRREKKQALVPKANLAPETSVTDDLRNDSESDVCPNGFQKLLFAKEYVKEK